MILLMGDSSSLPYSNSLSTSEKTPEKEISSLSTSPPTLVNEEIESLPQTLDQYSTSNYPKVSSSLIPSLSNSAVHVFESELSSKPQISSEVNSFTLLNSQVAFSHVLSPSSLQSLSTTDIPSGEEIDKSQTSTFSYIPSKLKESEDSNFKESFSSSKDGTLIITNLGKTYPSLTRIDIISKPNDEKPKDSAQEEDIYEVACRKIQNWWRIKQLKTHFHILKHRPSCSVNGSMNVLRHSHSRKGSEEYPLKHMNNEYVNKFNMDPASAVKEMLSKELRGLPEPHEVISTFLVINDIQINRAKLGDFFGQPDKVAQDTLRSYMNSINLEGITKFDLALRHVLSKFRLPGEAQKIMRILEAFANRFCFLNPSVFRDPTTAFVLAFSLIMLNTDAHNPAVTKKMSLPEFIKNNRGIDDGNDLPESLLRKLYFEIKCFPIKMVDNENSFSSLQRISGLDEMAKAKCIAEFSAWKFIKNTKHPRHLFLFKDKLLVTKIRPGPKYILNHSFDLGNIKLEKMLLKKPTDSSECLSSSNIVTLHTIFPRPDNEESEKESVDQISLGFDYSEELSIFWESLHRQKQELEEEKRAFQESLPSFVANRVQLTKSQIEGSLTRRYTASAGSLRATRLNLQKTASHVNQSIKQSKTLIQNSSPASTRTSTQQGYLSSLPKKLGSFIGVLPTSAGEPEDEN